MSKKESYIEYVKTAFITFLILIAISFVVLVFARIHVRDHVSVDELALQNDMIGYLIAKYKHEETKKPNDAVINLRLGQLYEMLESYVQAEQEYLKAIKKSNGRFETASFKLAGVYLMQYNYELAEDIMGAIPDSSRYSRIYEKGRFYKLYGDVLFNKERYKDAIEQYEMALFYLKKIESGLCKEIEETMCDIYVLLADKYVSQSNINDAFSLLQKAYEHCKSPVIMYKLGLLNLDKNPEYSVDLFEDVLKRDSHIINFSLYKKLLFSLKMQFAYSGELTKSKLYDAKLTRLQTYINRNVLQSGELSFEDYEFQLKKYPIKNEVDLVFSFKLRNVTEQDISKLSAIVDILDESGEVIYTHKENLLHTISGLKAGSDALSVHFVIKMNKKSLSKFEKLEAKLYLAKNPKVSTLLYTNNKFDVTKGKKSK